MSRIVLFSFLGTGFYDPHIYTYGDKACKETNYTQVAIYEILKELHEDVEVFVFLTEQARKLNWQDGYREKKENGVKKEVFNVGLKNSLYEFDPNIKLHDILIPGPGDIEESWKLFDVLLEHIEENDTVYFDMTHGFRSIPFISFIVLQYARKLKNITFGGLFYGEIAGDSGRIVDYTEMTSLVEWAEGVNQYLETGSAKVISKQVNLEKSYLFKTKNLEAKDSNYIGLLGGIADQLKRISDSFETSRGISVFNEIEKLRIQISNFEAKESNYLKALIPLLDQVEKKLVNYDKNKASRIKFVVDWCIEHNLVQQAYTLLVEYVISAICDYAHMDQKDKNDRKVVSSTINHIVTKRPYKEWAGKDQFKERCLNLYDKIKKFQKFFTKYHELNDLRNDINHAEFRNSPNQANIFVKKLPNLSAEMYDLIKKLYE